MIELCFYVRFQSQLKRTRTELLRSIQESMLSAIQNTGGVQLHDYKSLAAVYDEGVLAFPLDLAVTLQALTASLEEGQREFYGHAIVVKDRDLSLDTRVCLDLAQNHETWGLWCDPRVKDILTPYASFSEKSRSGFFELLNFREEEYSSNSDNLEAINDRLIEAGEAGSCAFIISEGAPLGKRLHILYHKNKDAISPYVVSFGYGGKGPACLLDGLTPELEAILYPEGSGALGESLRFIQRNRLRETEPTKGLEEVEHLLSGILTRYMEHAKRRSTLGILVIEQVHLAEPEVRALALKISEFFGSSSDIRVYITGAEECILAPWADLGFNINRISVRRNISCPPMTCDLRELVYALELLLPYMAPHELPATFLEGGKSQAFMDRAMAYLLRNEIIPSMERPVPIHTEPGGAGASLSAVRRDYVLSFARKQLLARVEDGRLNPSFNLLRALYELGDEGDDDLVLDGIELDLKAGTYRGIRRAIDTATFPKIVGFHRAPTLEALVPSSLALLHGDLELAKKVADMHLPTEFPTPRYEAYLLCNRAAVHLGFGEIKKAQELIKTAILRLQNLSYNKGLARAYRIFAILCIARHQVRDSVDYLNFALDLAERTRDGYEIAICSFYSASAHFLLGNYSQAERNAKHAEDSAHTQGLSYWGCRARFFRARIYFETGRYRDARDLFDTLDDGMSKLWRERCRIFEGSADTLEPEGCREALLFSVEQAFLNGKMDRVLNLTERCAMPNMAVDFIHTENTNGVSGFNYCEDIPFPDGSFIVRMLSAYRALGLCCKKTVEEADREEAHNLMQKFLKEESLPEADPYDTFYYYVQYRVQREINQSELDISTALSVAFKRLQRRAGRIDDTVTKRSFLFLNRWNAELMAAAKEHNLI